MKEFWIHMKRLFSIIELENGLQIHQSNIEENYS